MASIAVFFLRVTETALAELDVLTQQQAKFVRRLTLKNK